MFLKFPDLYLPLVMKEKILEKAADMFLTYGFKSITMDDLAQEMGISKKTIYAHFENKTALVKDCTLQVARIISSGIDSILCLNKNPIEELYEIKKFIMQYLKDEKSSPHYQLQKYYPKIFSSMRQKQYEVMKDCVVDNIKRGLEQGIYRENLNVEFISRIYYAGGASIKDHTLFPPDKFTNISLMDLYLEYHLRGIVTPKGRKILNTIINSNQE
ncbi:TetR family transcriptional regulator [Flavobacteriaceae bacterium MAR_2009_75]|nr:TetR family transcriptional regulator [Flavobacteriaceae bacterium MAR_2009_75]